MIYMSKGGWCRFGPYVDPPLETGCLTVCGCPGASAFLLKKYLCPPHWKFLDLHLLLNNNRLLNIIFIFAGHDRSHKGRRKRAAIFRWHIAYTLLNNPSIIGTRKRLRSLSFAETRKRISELATTTNHDQHILMPHAQQLMIRTQTRKGDVVAPEGVTLDDLEIAVSVPTTPTTPNSTELASLQSSNQEQQQAVENTVEETNDTAELIDETGDSDRSSTPLEPVA